MKILIKFLIILSLIFSIIQIYYEFYLTSLVNIFCISFIFYTVKISNKGIITRILIFLTFFISYPISFMISLLNLSTKSSSYFWKTNSFVFNDINSAYVILISTIFYFILIISHLFISCLLSNNNEIFLNQGIKITNDKKLISNKVNKYKKFIIPFLFTTLISIIFLHNHYGWGVHGLPPLQPNFYKLLGISLYLRDYFIPIIMIYYLSLVTRISSIDKILLLFSFVFISIYSLSKVTFIFYLLIFSYSFLRNDFLNDKNNILKIKFIIIFLISFVVYFYIIQLRDVIINQGNGVHILRELKNLWDNEFFNFKIFIFKTSYIYSIIERFLGFKELSSVLFYQGTIDNYISLMHILGFDQSSKAQYVSVRNLTGSNIGGGIGIDWVSNLVLCGYFMIIPFLLIIIHFFLQVLTINLFTRSSRIVIEIISAIILIRFLVDGDFSKLKFVVILFAITCLILSTLKNLKISQINKKDILSK